MIGALSLILILAGCGKSVFSLEMNEDLKSGTITLEKASKGDFVTSGSLHVDEGDTVYIEPALEGDSEINIKLIGAIEGADGSEEIEEVFNENDPVLDVDINGTDPTECGLPAGDYYISVTVVKKATGTVMIRAENTSVGIANPWSSAASAEEAAKGAGLDSFEVPAGAKTSLGALDTIDYRYMDGMAEAQIPVAAVELTVRKGNGEDDISGDYNSYKNKWSAEINGITVMCFGNREGEATKTVWVSEGCSYAVLAYGAGGDEDFGLQADDLNIIVSGVK